MQLSSRSTSRRYRLLVSFVWVCLLLSGISRALSQGVAVGSRSPQPAAPLPTGLELPSLRYEDVAAAAGLTGPNVSGSERRKTFILESTGTGVAILDYDNDGLQDIFLVNSDRFGSRSPRATHYLYRNLGNLRFRDMTQKADIGHTGWGQGVCAGDIDDDGFTDLFVTHWGKNVLYRNQGDGTFRDETKSRQLSSQKLRWGTGCAFLDFDRDGDLDLFVANYLQFDPEATPRPGENEYCRWMGAPVVCGPRGLPKETMSLYANDSCGVFQDVSEKAGIAVPKEYYGFTVLTGDFDDDGWPDVYVACDSTPSLMFHNQQDGTFEEIGVSSGTAYNEDGQEQAGMGATAGDYDHNGFLDIFRTNFARDFPTLYRNSGDWNFSDRTIPAGLGVHSQFVGWGASLVDFDQDGWKDIFVANGHVYPEVDEQASSESFSQQRLVFWNRRDGKFHDLSGQAGPGILARHSSRGVAIGDLDNDGTVEIVVVNMNETPSLLKNLGPTGNSILVQALTRSGRDAVGAQITLQMAGDSQVDEVRSGGFHISQGDFRVHFGMGSRPKGDISIRWPRGETETFRDIEANQWIVIREGEGVIKVTRLGETTAETAR